jgi:hypothetical protein
MNMSLTILDMALIGATYWFDHFCIYVSHHGLYEETRSKAQDDCDGRDA